MCVYILCLILLYRISKAEIGPSHKQTVAQASQGGAEPVPMYCKNELVSAESELCFEELRAQRYFKKCAQKREMQKWGIYTYCGSKIFIYLMYVYY